MNDLAGKVIVITGASSGLGREAARQFATRGCRLVLAARREHDLEETAHMCREAGGSAVVIATDVTEEAQVEALAHRALSAWGQIDVWVNNAGVTLFAPLEQGSFEEHRRVIETNVFGAMLCARAVLPIFRRQRRGILIDVGSILSKVGQPFVPSYVISKFAVRGMSEALRAEVAEEPNIHVCTLLPFVIDTPHFQTGANAIGLEPHAMPLMQSPEKVARALVSLAERPRRELHVPRIVALGFVVHWLWPRTSERLLLRALRRWHFSDVEQPRTEGNLYVPPDERGTRHGSRPPQISTPAFALWVARELLRIELQALGSWAQRFRASGASRVAPSRAITAELSRR
jgi:short-subunit dehydrogenase